MKDFDTQPRGTLRTPLCAPTAFAWRIGVWLALLATSSALLATGSALATVPACVMLGLAMAHGVELQHQALHSTGFRSRRANEWWGIALGLPMLVSFHEYRINHLKHHALLGTAADREHFDYGIGNGKRALLRRLFLVAHYRKFLGNMIRTAVGQDIPGFTTAQQPQVRRFHCIVSAAFATLAVLCIATRSAWPLLCWLIALLAVASPVHALVELPEHHGCERDSTDPMRNTRSLTSNVLMTWFTNANNLHVEHHMRPELPLQHLPALHAQLRGRLRYCNPGYLDFFQSTLRTRRTRVLEVA